MLEDLIKAAKDHALERLSSPFLGAFAVAWALINYKFLVILFSDASVSRTFEMIETVAFPTTAAWFLRGFAYPAAVSALYVFAYPYPARFIYGFTQRRQREIVKLRREIEDETPLTVEDSRKIRAQLREMESKHRAELDRLSGELSDEKNKSARQSEGSSATAEGASPSKSPTASQFRLLQIVGAGGGRVARKSIPDGKVGKTKVDFDLGELQEMGLALERYSQDLDDSAVTLTHEGRRLYVAMEAAKSQMGDAIVTE